MQRRRQEVMKNWGEAALLSPFGVWTCECNLDAWISGSAGGDGDSGGRGSSAAAAAPAAGGTDQIACKQGR